MPFKSEAQRRYLYAKEPTVAAEFQSKTPKDADLPEKVVKRRGKPQKSLKSSMVHGR